MGSAFRSASTWLFLTLFCGLLFPLPALAEPASAPPLRSAHDFWAQSPAQRTVERDIELTFQVLFYDPEWRLLWGEDKDGVFFLKPGIMPPLPLHAGKRIHLKGHISSDKGLLVDPDSITSLGEGATPVPIVADALLDNPAEVNQRIVTLSGYVDEQTEPDATHLSLGLIVQNTPVNVHIRTSKRQSLLGSQVEVTGLLATERLSGIAERLNLWVRNEADLRQKGFLHDDPRLQLPISSSTQVRKLEEGKPAHVRGTVKLQRPGSELWLADDTGEIVIESPQRTLVANGELVDAIGQVSTRGARPGLSIGIYLPTAKLPAHSDSQLGTITRINEWFLLPIDIRQQDMPIDAVFRVSYYDPYWKMLWVQDDRGCYYLHTNQATFNFSYGQLLRIRGLYSETKGLRAEEKNIEVLETQLNTEPDDITNSVTEFSRFNSKLVALTGYVDRQQNTDPQHDTLSIVCNGYRLTATVLHTDGIPLRHYEGSIIKARGLYNSVADSANGSTQVNLMVSGSEQLSFLHWLRADPAFQLPITPIERISSLSKPSRIHLAGVVQEVLRKSHVELRDKTGQVRILCAQDENLRKGEYIEVMGTPVTKGLQTILQGGLFIRSMQSLTSSDSTDSSQLLRLVGQVQELSSAQAAHGYPVKLTVQCTWSSPAAGYFYAQDASGGMRFILSDTGLSRPQPGDLVQLLGETVASSQDAQVLTHELKVLYTAATPAPIPVNLDQARTGVGANQTVELQALLRGYQRAGEFIELDYLSSLGAFKGLLPATENPASLVGSIVSTRGINLVNRSKLRTPEIQLLHNSLADLGVTEPKPRSLEEIARITLPQLALNPPKPGVEHLVRIRGTVTLHQRGSHLYIEEGSEAMRALSNQVEELIPGDTVEVTGLPVWQGDRLVIQEGAYRKSGHQLPGKPILPKTPYAPDPELDGFLVRVEGRSLDTTNLLLNAGIINLQNGNLLFSCTLNDSRRSSLEIKPGTRLIATGIYHLIQGEGIRPGTFSIELRSPADLEILEAPSWWTPERAMAVVGLFALMLMLTVGWIQLLRKKVYQQTAIIRAQVDKEAKLMAELERSARLESLGLLAGGIAHDFNNMLTVVAGNLTLARMEDGVEQAAGQYLTEAEQGALRARALTQQLLTFARGGNPVRKPEYLPELVEDEVRKAVSHAKVELLFSSEPGLWRAFIDKTQIAQVIHNLVTNALQAMPQGGRLSVNIANHDAETGDAKQQSPRMVRLQIQDNGEGIDADNLSKIFDPYFSTRKGQRGLGLSLVRSIIKKHDGQLSVTSSRGVGTTFTLILPAANEQAEEARSTRITSGSKPPLGMSERPRILFMDDEAPIRLIAGTLLRKLGYDAVLVADGESAVREHRKSLEEGRPFNLLVFDLAVPEGMGGREALERIHAVDPQALALVSSGYSNDPVMSEPQRFGFAAVLPKPYQVNELARTIDTLLGREHRPTGMTVNPNAPAVT